MEITMDAGKRYVTVEDPTYVLGPALHAAIDIYAERVVRAWNLRHTSHHKWRESARYWNMCRHQVIDLRDSQRSTVGDGFRS